MPDGHAESKGSQTDPEIDNHGKLVHIRRNEGEAWQSGKVLA
jgi:hypothetical protein